MALPPVAARVTPQRIRDNICHRAAFEQFYLQNMHDTKRRTGILLYVSVLERYAGVLADEGIRAHVKDSEWDALIKAFTAELRKGRVREGYIAAVQGAKTLLAAHFPGKRKPVNELDDHLVELPESRLIN
jgi:putative membrane protein